MSAPLEVDTIVADFLSKQNTREWGDSVLHLTDLAKCPREVVMRIRKFDIVPLTPQEIKQFEQAKHAEWYITEAIREAGRLVVGHYQLTLPEGWSGELDLVVSHGDRVRITDIKASHPNQWTTYNTNINPSAGDPYTKPDHQLQVSAYAAFYDGPRVDDLDDRGEVWYTDRGGSNRTIRTICDLLPRDIIEEKMAALERARDADDLPPCLPCRLLRRSAKKHGAAGVYLEPVDWRCSYCRAKDCVQRNFRMRLTRDIQGKDSLIGVGDRWWDELTEYVADQDKWPDGFPVGVIH